MKLMSRLFNTVPGRVPGRREVTRRRGSAPSATRSRSGSSTSRPSSPGVSRPRLGLGGAVAESRRLCALCPERRRRPAGGSGLRGLRFPWTSTPAGPGVW